ncbi:MAG: RNA-splicing ligase RtcB, partial [candidate division Zixibacteria bacterium]|nr:RNA-splicing ligase RtcB [candidate division Zixibacteria bacterium]
LYSLIPCGVGGKGILKLSDAEFRRMTTLGARWCVDNGYGRPDDLKHTEEGGCLAGADPEKCSDRAVERGRSQLGTLGSGNHYLEVQVVQPDNVYDPKTAEALGIDRPYQIVVMVHCGSRGFGHQVASDYLKVFTKAMKRFGIETTDKELGCAPYRSDEGRDYFGAMNCAANSAFANRQVITHRIREGFTRVFGKSENELGLDVIYDVCHNIAKLERYEIDGQQQDLLVHRKGATRSFGPGSEHIPDDYRAVGQPVIVGGSMETGSYLLVGTEKAMTGTFGSTLHGSGRVMSRTKARKSVRGETLRDDMLKRGIAIRTASLRGLAEEAGFAYKDIAEVVRAVDDIGISRRVVRFIPIGNIKG